MFDTWIRGSKDRWLALVVAVLNHLSPNVLTVTALGIGLSAAVAASQAWYALALILWLLNRVIDGLDGAVARAFDKQTDIGGYLDILLDFTVYAAVPIGAALSMPSTPNLMGLALLLAVFYVNAASWMYLSAVMEKRYVRDEHSPRRQQRLELTSVAMPAGLIGGTETFIFYCLFLIMPGQLPWLFVLMALLVSVTVIQRVVWAVRHL
jgi:phosphatidylglycerophosphate synthase